MHEYIKRVDLVLPGWRDMNAMNNPLNDISKADESGTFGIKMSIMSQEEDKIDEADKTCFDLVQEGSLEKLKKCFEKNKCKINETDENGMTLLMWACDRGHLDIVKYILGLGADVNKRDREGQTCLHYAVSCDYLEIIKILLESKLSRMSKMTKVKRRSILLKIKRSFNCSNKNIKDLNGTQVLKLSKDFSFEEMYRNCFSKKNKKIPKQFGHGIQ